MFLRQAFHVVSSISELLAPTAPTGNSAPGLRRADRRGQAVFACFFTPDPLLLLCIDVVNRCTRPIDAARISVPEGATLLSALVYV
jgi:hypothetical protein